MVITVVLDVTPRSLVEYFRTICCLNSEDKGRFYSEDGGSIFLRNVSVDPPTTWRHILEDSNLKFSLLDRLRVLNL
jgi:hypothetical protein